MQSPKPTPKAKKLKKKDPVHVVKLGRTEIPIYRTGRGQHIFRYYVAGVPKLITRADLAEAIEAAEGKASGIENGRVQAGDLSAADVQSFYHANEKLAELGANAPPLHVALEEYVAARRLLPVGASLVGVVRTHLAAQPAAGDATPIAEVLRRFLVVVDEHSKNPRNRRGIRHDLTRFVAWLPEGRTLPEVKAEEINTYLRALVAGTMTDAWNGRVATQPWPAIGERRRDNIRDEIVNFFRFARANGHLPEDRTTEAEKVKSFKPTHEITFYTPEQIRAFLVHLKDEWVPWFVLSAFAGLRSSEIVGDKEDPDRARLRWSDFRWEKKYLVVPKSTAKKIKRARRVPLRENLLQWLLPYRNATGYLYPEGAEQRIETERLERLKDAKGRSLGLVWDANALRHSYGTHRNAEISNAGQVAEEMGTSVQRIRENYDAVPADIEPDEYFGIIPGGGAEIIEFPAQG